MILFLATLVLFRKYSTFAAPISSHSKFDVLTSGNELFERSTNSDACLSRTIWDILWSCLATTFACTWVSVHPNIPFLRENKWVIKKWRLYLMFLTLLAPEILLMWAFKQCQGALMIRETVNDARPKSITTKWTMTHAHYLQMGGFRVHCTIEEIQFVKPKFGYRTMNDDDRIYEVLISLDGFKSLLSQGLIDFPSISEAEIEDKSGRDALSKAIAMLQLAWFILQIAARVHQNLAITELELTTAALASLNIAMYMSWWNKPIDVLCPTIIRTKDVEERLRERKHQSKDSGLFPTILNGASDEKWNFHENATTSLASYCWCKSVESFLSLMDDIFTFVRGVFYAILAIPQLFRRLGTKIKRLCAKDTCRPPNESSLKRNIISSTTTVMIICITAPWHATLHVFLASILYPVQAILASSYFPRWRTDLDATEIDSKSTLDVMISKNHLRLLMEMVFSSEEVENSPFFCFSAITGAVFGAIHCSAWDFQFPSRVERVFWRVSSLCVLGLCFLLLVCGVAYSLYKRRHGAIKRQTRARPLFQSHFLRPGALMSAIGAIPAIFYIVSRVCLLVLSITTLRALPPSAFDTVQWSEFIPHI